MSQHDLDIADAAGAAFLTDLNLSLKALGSLSSGSSAPATTYAYQWWLDTASAVLKMRNSANSAWVTMPMNIATGLIALAGLDSALLVTASETIASNDNDTTIPTSAAVKDLVEAAASPATTAAQAVGTGNSPVFVAVKTAGIKSSSGVASFDITAGTGDISLGIGNTDVKVKLPVASGIYKGASDTAVLTESSGTVTLDNVTMGSSVVNVTTTGRAIALAFVFG
jgi:hypothetical protein